MKYLQHGPNLPLYRLSPLSHFLHIPHTLYPSHTEKITWDVYCTAFTHSLLLLFLPQDNLSWCLSMASVGSTAFWNTSAIELTLWLVLYMFSHSPVGSLRAGTTSYTSWHLQCLCLTPRGLCTKSQNKISGACFPFHADFTPQEAWDNFFPPP